MGITNFSQLEMGVSSVTGASAAATSSTQHTILTTESLTTAAGAVASYTFNNKLIKTDSVVIAQVVGGSFSAGTPVAINSIVTATGVSTIKIANIHASAALNGTLKLSVLVLNSANK